MAPGSTWPQACDGSEGSDGTWLPFYPSDCPDGIPEKRFAVVHTIGLGSTTLFQGMFSVAMSDLFVKTGDSGGPAFGFNVFNLDQVRVYGVLSAGNGTTVGNSSEVYFASTYNKKTELENIWGSGSGIQFCSNTNE